MRLSKTNNRELTYQVGGIAEEPDNEKCHAKAIGALGSVICHQLRNLRCLSEPAAGLRRRIVRRNAPADISKQSWICCRISQIGHR